MYEILNYLGLLIIYFLSFSIETNEFFVQKAKKSKHRIWVARNGIVLPCAIS